MATDVVADVAAATERYKILDEVQKRVLWLSVYMVDYANHGRPNPTGLKVGGHQASSASVVTILTYLYFEFMKAGDRISIKPHSSPVFHAIQYLLGNLDAEYLKALRGFHGLQAYPSRTKDPDGVDFSTGSVGLGAVAPNFAWLTEEYVRSHTQPDSGIDRRYISLLGDAELDEGAVWEAIAEPALTDIKNVLWIIDLNRQSLDRIIPGIRVEAWRQMFPRKRLEGHRRQVRKEASGRLRGAEGRPAARVHRRDVQRPVPAVGPGGRAHLKRMAPARQPLAGRHGPVHFPMGR